MPQFTYKAIDGNGKERRGTVNAASAEEANSQVTGMGLMPTEISEAKGRGKKAGSGGVKAAKKKSSLFGRIKNEEVTLFTRQLATLLRSGVPLLRALDVMERQEKNAKLASIIEGLAENVRAGNSFSDGLTQYPRIFDKLYVNMVRAGEAGGILETVLDRLAGFMEKSLRLRKRVKSAMIYPSVVIFVAVVIVVLLMVVVVPKFEEIFANMLKGAALPPITQVVVGSSRFVQENIFVVLGVLVGAIVLLRLFVKTKVGARAKDLVVFKLPKIGDLLGKANIARFTRTFGTLLSSGVPILDSLVITREVVSNRYFADAIGRIHDQVRDGESVAAPMSNEKLFPSMVTSMVEVGEETGELDQMLTRVADNYDEDVDNAVNGITSIIEPVMIVFLAVVVGFIVIALFMPIIRIIETLTV
ncbi:MAG: type II secretion system F family protein [Puniceicoccaceae bacterium]